MKKNLIPLIVLLPVGIFSYLYNFISFLLLAVIVLSALVLLVGSIIRTFRKNLSPGWLKVPMMIIAVCLTGVMIGLIRPLEQATLSTGTASDKLAYAYKTDQAERMTIGAYLGIFSDNITKQRDDIRLRQVSQLYNNNQISLPMEKFHAAFILHHSKRSELFEIAQKLAGEAASVNELKDNYVVQWLAKATYDRRIVSLGKPEKYGTQGKFSVSVK